MITQWDSSLSALPVARAMIAQWDSSLSVLPVARAMIAQWDSSLSVLPGNYVPKRCRPGKVVNALESDHF